MSYFQSQSEFCYYHGHGILHNPRGSHFVTPHISLPPSVLAQTHYTFPHRARWRCVSPPQCNLAGLLSFVSSVTLCSHSIRAPRLRGATDKILIILASRIKETRTDMAHAYIYKHTRIFSQILPNANLTRRSTVDCYHTKACTQTKMHQMGTSKLCWVSYPNLCTKGGFIAGTVCFHLSALLRKVCFK